MTAIGKHSYGMKDGSGRESNVHRELLLGMTRRPHDTGTGGVGGAIIAGPRPARPQQLNHLGWED